MVDLRVKSAISVVLVPILVASSKLLAISQYNCYRRLFSLVGKVPLCSAGGSGLIPGRTNTQGLKIIEEKVLPLL